MTTRILWCICSATTLIVAQVFGLSTPSRAGLLYSAPNANSSSKLNDWYLHHIPTVFQAHNDLFVNEYYDAQMDAYLTSGSADTSNLRNNDNSGGDMSDVDGVFENDPPRLSLRIAPDGSVDFMTFAHEFGHYVWFIEMNDSERQRYSKLYHKQKSAHHLVTKYAETDTEEGFAEAFSFYVSQPAILAHRDSDSYQFLKQLHNISS